MVPNFVNVWSVVIPAMQSKTLLISHPTAWQYFPLHIAFEQQSDQLHLTLNDDEATNRDQHMQLNELCNHLQLVADVIY
jgi:hypothetical protein